MIIGIDFDNTLVNYDAVFFNRALDLGLIPQAQGKYKKEVRDQVRLLPDGELWWQKLQAYVYTEGVEQAHLIEGVKEFFISCRKAGIPTYIISHKTEYSPLAPEMNLRHMALKWMEAQGFFKGDVLGLNVNQVYFEFTRLEKIKRMKTLGCTHFIDDLQEVFLENSFPPGVQKILYAPKDQELESKDMIILDSWKEIHEHFFKR